MRTVSAFSLVIDNYRKAVPHLNSDFLYHPTIPSLSPTYNVELIRCVCVRACVRVCVRVCVCVRKRASGLCSPEGNYLNVYLVSFKL